jgi:hypothetical protein
MEIRVLTGATIATLLQAVQLYNWILDLFSAFEGIQPP